MIAHSTPPRSTVTAPGLGARLRRDRDGLLVFFVGIILFRVTAAVYFLTNLLVAAAPVVMLASGVAVASVTPGAVTVDRGGVLCASDASEAFVVVF